ncbi:MAG: elongation factor 1-beta [Candidatus Aenigmatarchaeota archaeon]|nr:MAG: elongation factor 1-beta [Candidatus Aenigmarchaeota archaeon ex4484_14]RLI97275.1 MAG: elongation factor 1-beta [Candidatus Aenigmarchaeota archaeon]
MGDVAIKLKVMPDGPEQDIEKIKKDIEEKVNPKQIIEKDIGFGLKALEVMVVRAPDKGGTDDLENALSEIEGVASVETESVTLI